MENIKESEKTYEITNKNYNDLNFKLDTFKKELIDTFPFNKLLFDIFNIELINVAPEIFNEDNIVASRV